MLPAASSLVGTLAGGALSTVLVGCSVLSPATIATPYAAADGVAGSLSNAADGSTVELRNMLVVAGQSGDRGLVVGTLANSGPSPVQVRLGLTPTPGETGAAPATITVPARGAVQLGSGKDQVVLDGVPEAGRLVQITVQTSTGGAEELALPVMAPLGYYASLTPPPLARSTP
jgi:hypothetical protein